MVMACVAQQVVAAMHLSKALSHLPAVRALAIQTAQLLTLGNSGTEPGDGSGGTNPTPAGYYVTHTGLNWLCAEN